MYKIVIKKDVQRTRMNWNKVADTGNKIDGGAVYDYVPCKEDAEVIILDQSLDELDLTKVIKAVNGIE